MTTTLATRIAEDPTYLDKDPQSFEEPYCECGTPLKRD